MIDRLVLVNSIGLGAPAPRACLLLLAALFVASEEVAFAWMGAAMFGGHGARPKAMMYDMVARSGRMPRGLRGFWIMFSRTWDIARPIRPRGLAQVRQPTLIVWGADDPCFPIAHARRAARHMATSRVELMHGAGHIPFLQQPREFVSIVERFLQEG